MKTTIAIVFLMLIAWPVDSKHHQLRGELGQSNANDPFESLADNNQRHLHKKKRHGNGKRHYRHVPPNAHSYDRYHQNVEGPNEYKQNNKKQHVHSYDRYHQNVEGPNEYKQSCRDCKKACYGFECSLSCCHKHKVKPEPSSASCQDCSKPCYGDECAPECCDMVEDVDDGCFSCAKNNPCTDENRKGGDIFYIHCDADRFIQCDDSNECFELPMSLLDLLVSEHVSGGESQ